MNYRCFIALEAVEAVRRNLEEHLSRFRVQLGVNWVTPANLHLTLLFLGDVEAALIPDLEKILADSAKQAAAFPLALQGLEIFPAKQPRLIWATLAAQNEDIFRWHKDLLASVRAAGFEPDAKPLRLHITLGRIKSALPVWLEREIMQSAVDSATYPYDTITLYRSVLKPEGPTYHILNQCKLT